MFKVTISETNATSARLKAMVKDYADAAALKDLLVSGKELFLKPSAYAVLDVHNDQAKDNQNYKVLVILNEDGAKYCSGSASLIKEFPDKYNDYAAIVDEGDTDVSVKLFARDSKNNKGGVFFTCTIA